MEKQLQQSAKPWYESWTIRFNGTTMALLIAVLAFLSGPESPITIGPELQAAIAALITVLGGNLFLRTKTDSAIVVRKPK